MPSMWWRPATGRAPKRVLPRLSRSANHGLLWFGTRPAWRRWAGAPGARAALRGRGLAGRWRRRPSTRSASARCAGRGPLLDAVPWYGSCSASRSPRPSPPGTRPRRRRSRPVWPWSTSAWGRRWRRWPRRWRCPASTPGCTIRAMCWRVRRWGSARRSPCGVSCRPAPSWRRPPAARRGARTARRPGPGRGREPGSRAAHGPALGPRRGGARRCCRRPRCVVCGGPDGEPLDKALEDAAERAERWPGARECSAATARSMPRPRVALRHGLPLAVLPGGTLNHFAYDLGIETSATRGRAVATGEAVAVDVARFTGPDGASGGAALPQHLLAGRVSGAGADPRAVGARIGGWPAGVLAALGGAARPPSR